ncbi:MAG: hypothetical protein LKF87_14555 [Clostridium tyrobutyricum]|uniref:hypothetical protein n=1 Tax=Clostridium tyrobutyricum TaxID=1519 RepID=UPI001FA943B8|nr:hypothetical protein [Clostridium tyrobutyricum]MCH4200657.1 hypothetical protein [Clostridium tyrobutyricum]MCH4237555.1 hypothetical protein [Clostridium tyrobutyricum]MCH4260134.1 hypothetical protein [Clostridium tyrobutyricum]MCI2011756.1 hypothetical protein [Clostridium tyrobutyricum]
MNGYLYHLTKANSELDDLEVLTKILNDRKLTGSEPGIGFIVGRNRTVCFQDTTTYGLCQNSYYEQNLVNYHAAKVRYVPLGLTFSKTYVYNKGGRSVFYEKTETVKKLLKEDEW